ncbi:MAG: aminopeptidase [Isosphaeraceae bacterium]|jgi:hypothetical protein|nr:MAG: aminopeptidase [Isosphaeraceae bacterium]
MRSWPHIIGFLPLLWLSAPSTWGQAPPGPSAPVPEAALDSISPGDIRGHMTFLASDLMRGRDTLSPEIRIAADYLATRLLMAGAEPAGDLVDGTPTYFAEFPLESSRPREEQTELVLTIERDEDRETITLNAVTDFVTVPFGLAPGEISAPLVFVGEGREEDYADLDVAGRFILAVEAPTPEPDNPEAGAARPATRSLFDKANRARSKGAVGIIVVHAPGAEAPPYHQTLATFKRGFARRLISLGSRAGTNFPTIALEDPARDQLTERLGLADVLKPGRQPGPIDHASVTFRFALDVQVLRDRNVIGLFPGTDPEKANEVILYSAHYDHVGTGEGEGDQIFNGSDDNASGTSALLEIAQAFGMGPRPARSIAFLWVSGEEKGLLGSRYFSDHVTLPEGYRIVGNINMDMVSRNDAHQIGITPSPQHPKFSSLTQQAVEACAAEGVEALFNADQFFFRTDSASFAAKGIPVVFFFSGLHADYHRPSDEVDKADFDKAARIARVAYRLGWTAANAPDPPHLVVAESTETPKTEP